MDVIVNNIAILCIDSLRAIRNDRLPVCLHFAKELAWRLGALIYMMDHLKNEHDALADGLKGGESHEF